MAGKVYLTGAGPGDPDLLTVKALRVLRRADVILHDDLVSPAVLALVPPGAVVVNVGKRCGQKHVRQEDIHTLMIAYARRGLSVVRLKGGDPLIFSRAGEEIEALHLAQVPFEVVPGVTAAAAAAAAAGIPLTHRMRSSALVFFTGHCSAEMRGEAWPELAAFSGQPPSTASAPRATVVVYMPGADYARLRRRLLCTGLPGATPCLLVGGASTPECVTHRTTVDGLPSAPPLPSPRLLIAGEVARLGAPAGARRRAAPEIFNAAAELATR